MYWRVRSSGWRVGDAAESRERMHALVDREAPIRRPRLLAYRVTVASSAGSRASRPARATVTRPARPFTGFAEARVVPVWRVVARGLGTAAPARPHVAARSRRPPRTTPGSTRRTRRPRAYPVDPERGRVPAASSYRTGLLSTEAARPRWSVWSTTRPGHSTVRQVIVGGRSPDKQPTPAKRNRDPGPATSSVVSPTTSFRRVDGATTTRVDCRAVRVAALIQLAEATRRR
jgi:hypothetical protein